MVKNSQQFKLLDVASVSNRHVSKYVGQKQYVATGDIRLNKIVGGEAVTYDDKPSRADLVLGEDEVLFAKMKDTLKVLSGLPDFGEMIFSTGFYVLAPGDKLSKRFLYMFLLSDYFNEQKNFYCTGATMSGLNNEGLGKIMINLPVDKFGNPDIAQQEKVAASLEKLEEIKKKRAMINGLSSQVIPTVFLEMFGDPLTNPNKWSTKKLGELCTIRRGASPRPIKNYLGGNIPWIKIGDATNGDELYIEKTETSVTEEGAEKSVFLKKGSLVFANCGVSLGFARILKIDGCIHDGWLAFENLDGSLNEHYLLKLINVITPYLRRIASAGTQPNLNIKIMSDLEIMLPPIELQEKFSRIILDMEASIRKQKEATSAIDELFATSLSEVLDNRSMHKIEPQPAPPIKLFPIQQAIGLTLQRGFKRGEMVIDKVLYLAQEVFGVKLSIPFAPYKLGPWSIKVKDAVAGGMSKKTQFFKKEKMGHASVLALAANSDKLFSYSEAHVLKDMGAALDQLLPIIKFWKSPEVECLATVCKVIQDNKTDDATIVIKKVGEWKPGKFTSEEINKVLAIAVDKKWAKKLLS